MPGRKIYSYRNLSFQVADETDVEVVVNFISDGNSGPTVINVPGDDDPIIDGEGSANLGKAKNLRNVFILFNSVLVNGNDAEDEVIVEYLINGKRLLEHRNPRSEERRPIIKLSLKIIKP